MLYPAVADPTGPGTPAPDRFDVGLGVVALDDAPRRRRHRGPAVAAVAKAVPEVRMVDAELAQL